MKSQLLPEEHTILWKCSGCNRQLTISRKERKVMAGNVEREQVTFMVKCFCSEIPNGWVHKEAKSTKRLPMRNRQQ